MSKKISAKKLHEQWRADPEYVDAYEALEGEFSIAAAIVGARDRAGLSQAQLAKRMGAKQSLVGRLESGAENTTIKTLRRVAEATGTELKISFDR